MIRKRPPIYLLIAILLTLLSAPVAVAQGSARVRFAHVAASSPSVDIYVNGELAAADISYTGSSAYLRLPAGNAQLDAYHAGSKALLFGQVISIEAESAATLILSSDTPSRFILASDNLRPLEYGSSRLQILNLLDEGPAVDVFSAASGEMLGEAIPSGSALGPIEIPAGMFEFVLKQSEADDRAIIDLVSSVSAGTSHFVMIHGNPDDPQALTATAALDAPAGSGMVRFLHAVSGAAALDLSVNDQLIIPSLRFASPSEHIAIPSGSHRVALSLVGSEITSTTLNVRAGQMQTVVIMGALANMSAFIYSDNLTALDESAAVVSVINAVPASIANRVQLDSGAIVAFDLAFAEDSGPAQIVPGQQGMVLDLSIGEDRGDIHVQPSQFYGGSYYNLVALPGSTFSAPTVLIAETSVQRGVSASFEAGDMVAEPVVVTDAPEPAAEAAPVIHETVAEEDVAEAEAPAESAPAVEETRKVDAFSPYAIVDLEPDANLQLRQYPTSDAMSLGLLSGGTDLIVLGRRGPSEYHADETADEPVDMSDYVSDPAAALYPVEDLPPADTWLFVAYKTPDDGAIYGWVSAYYLNVYNVNGDRQRLASLPMTRQNEAGSSLNTSLKPPQLSDLVSARVINLDSEALLNLRMSNGPQSEVLAQLEPDTRLKFLGLDGAEEWAFVEYESSATKMIKGWASANYIQLLLNGAPTTANSLRALDETVVPLISDSTSGGVRDVEPAMEYDTVSDEEMMSRIIGEVNLDPGAAMHFRRHPDRNSESLALLGTGTQVPIDGITANGEWLKARFNDQEGWLATPYVKLLREGRLYLQSFLRGLLHVYDDAGG